MHRTTFRPLMVLLKKTQLIRWCEIRPTDGAATRRHLELQAHCMLEEANAIREADAVVS